MGAPAGSWLADELARVGVEHVFAMPSLGADAAIAELAADTRICVTTTWHETSAFAAAHGCAMLTAHPTGVLVDAHWGDVGGGIQRIADDAALPIVTVSASTAGAGRRRPDADLPAPETGPVWWRWPQGTIDSARDVVRADDECPPLDDWSDPAPLALLPAPWQRGRAQAVNLVRQAGLRTITTTACDTFATRHPQLWAGRVGFLPSTGVWRALTAGHPVLCLGDVRPPAWACGPRFRWDGEEPGRVVAPAPLAAEPAVATGEPSSRSPLATVVRMLHAVAPTATFVADAGAAHRVVAGEVANTGARAVFPDQLTPMGWSLAAALGVATAAPASLVIPVIGDGSALSSGAGIAWLVAAEVPAVVVIACNDTWGARTDPGVRLPAIDWRAWATAQGAVALPMAGLSVDGLSVDGLSVDGRSVEERCAAAISLALESSRVVVLPVRTPPVHAADVAHPTGIAALDALIP